MPRSVVYFLAKMSPDASVVAIHDRLCCTDCSTGHVSSAWHPARSLQALCLLTRRKEEWTLLPCMKPTVDVLGF